MPIITKCLVCHVEDELQNLTKVSNAKDAYAHQWCIERHNKGAEKNLRALDVSMTASLVRDHDINVDDSYAVETFLRRQNPKVGKRFIAEVINAALEQRDRDNAEWAASEESAGSRVEMTIPTTAFPGRLRVWLAGGLPCPHCRRPLHANDVMANANGVALVCSTGCHKDVLTIDGRTVPTEDVW